MKYNLGEKNELEFVNCLDGKRISEINPMFLSLIEDLFDNVDKNDLIKCIKNKYPTKTDIFIKIRNHQRRISVKMGYNNSVHVERISSFIHFLIENGISRDLIIKYLKFHYADNTTNGTGLIRLSSEQYKKDNQKDIDEINIAFNDENLIKKAISRFVLHGKNSKYNIDAIIYGIPTDFLWIKTDDIYKIILKKRNIYSTGIHFGTLFCQPQDRCINHNPLYEKRRYLIQIKWYSLFDDIIENMNSKASADFYIK